MKDRIKETNTKLFNVYSSNPPNPHYYIGMQYRKIRKVTRMLGK